jgi:hypothetical protein
MEEFRPMLQAGTVSAQLIDLQMVQFIRQVPHVACVTIALRDSPVD